MVLTVKQLQQFKDGLLSKSLFKKLLLTENFENYLYRYCKIISDYRPTETIRETTFLHYDIEILVTMELGICEHITYKEKLSNYSAKK